MLIVVTQGSFALLLGFDRVSAVFRLSFVYTNWGECVERLSICHARRAQVTCLGIGCGDISCISVSFRSGLLPGALSLLHLTGHSECQDGRPGDLVVLYLLPLLILRSPIMGFVRVFCCERVVNCDSLSDRPTSSKRGECLPGQCHRFCVESLLSLCPRFFCFLNVIVTASELWRRPPSVLSCMTSPPFRKRTSSSLTTDVRRPLPTSAFRVTS